MTSGLPPFELRSRQIEHVGRLHIGERPEHLLEFRQVGELRKSGTLPQAATIRRDFHRVDDFAERRRPDVEMFDTATPRSRNHCIVYISTIVLEIGVPVANVTPWPACCSSR